MYHIGHPGFKVHTSQDTLGGSIPHLYGGNDKIGLVFIFRDLHSRAMGNLRGWGTFYNMRFWFYKAGKKTGAHPVSVSLLSIHISFYFPLNP
jgi:hypothetical protein